MMTGKDGAGNGRKVGWESAKVIMPSIVLLWNIQYEKI